MKRLEDYRDAFTTIAFDRRDGILEMRLHSDEGPLRWSLTAHDELEQAFLDIARDPENEVVILSGTGAEFSGPDVAPGDSARREISHPEFEDIVRVGRRLIMNCLDIPVPMIAAVNGPCRRHPELPLMSDIVLISDNTLFQDPAHFRGGMVPGDGVHVVFPHLMGPLRANYFLLTGQEIGARQALELGLANEILSAERLMPRARDLAVSLCRQPRQVRYNTRMLMTQDLKEKMHRMLAFGLTIESLAHAAQFWDRQT